VVSLKSTVVAFHETILLLCVGWACFISGVWITCSAVSGKPLFQLTAIVVNYPNCLGMVEAFPAAHHSVQLVKVVRLLQVEHDLNITSIVLNHKCAVLLLVSRTLDRDTISVDPN
jgi:hypothetical protein